VKNRTFSKTYRFKKFFDLFKVKEAKANENALASFLCLFVKSNPNKITRPNEKIIFLFT